MKKTYFRLIIALLLTTFSNVAHGETNRPGLYAKLSSDNVLTVYYDNNWGYHPIEWDWDPNAYTYYDGVYEVFFRENLTVTENDNYGINGDLGRALSWIFTGFSAHHFTNADVHTIVFDSSLRTLQDIPIHDISALFSYSEQLTTIVGWENLDLSQITNISSMFYGCKSIKNIDLSSFHTEHLTDMSFLFAECISLESVNLSSFNTPNNVYAGGLFRNCQSLKTVDLSNFVLDYSDWQGLHPCDFFNENCTSLETIRLGALKCKTMERLFYGLTALRTLELTGPVTGFEQCSGMFENCSSLEDLDLSMLDTSNAKYMRSMFKGCTSLTSLDLSNFRTSNAETMEHMFYGCSNLGSIYVGDGWDISNVWSAGDMFLGCTNIVGQDGTTYNANETDQSKAHYGAGGYLRYKGEIVQPEIDPIETETNVDLPTDGNTINVVVSNVYYNLTGDDGYDETEGCIVINTPTDMTEVDGEPGSETVKENFSGLIFLVNGKGVIGLDCQTLGVDVLNVKVGSQEPTTISKNERGIIEVAYDVTEPTYVYVYATSARAGAPLRVSASENCVKLWSLTVKPGATLGISHTTATSPTSEGRYYTLDGRKVVTPTKGVYIYNGKKVILK